MIVSNASPLIYLSKITKLDFLKEKFGKVLLPKRSYAEIVGGKGLFSEVDKIEEAIKEGWIEISEVKDKEMNKLKTTFPNLGAGEIESIVVSKEKNLPVLLDDSYARRIAEALGRDVHGTIFVILKAFENKLISKEETIKLINKLIEEGFRISVELYSQLISKLRSV